MTREEIKAEVFRIINDHAAWNGFAPLEESHLLKEDLWFDSLDMVELIVDIEKRYDFEIPGEVVEGFLKVEDIINYLDKVYLTNEV